MTPTLVKSGKAFALIALALAIGAMGICVAYPTLPGALDGPGRGIIIGPDLW